MFAVRPVPAPPPRLTLRAIPFGWLSTVHPVPPLAITILSMKLPSDWLDDSRIGDGFLVKLMTVSAGIVSSVGLSRVIVIVVPSRETIND